MMLQWDQLTERERNDIMLVLASIFTTIGTDELVAAEWVNSGCISLVREKNGCRIMGPENPTSTEMIELAHINYD